MGHSSREEYSLALFIGLNLVRASGEVGLMTPSNVDQASGLGSGKAPAFHNEIDFDKDDGERGRASSCMQSWLDLTANWVRLPMRSFFFLGTWPAGEHE